ncbi:putative transcription factor 25 [Plasmopara halstedii]
MSWSARHAKRLAREREAEAHSQSLEEEESGEDDQKYKRSTNIGFSFLVDSDESESEDSDKEEQNEEKKEDLKKPSVAFEPSKSKNRKSMNGNYRKQRKGDDEIEEKQSLDDIFNAVLAEAGNLSVEDATSTRNEQEQSLFGVQLKFANADKEMKRIFGVKDSGPTIHRKRGDPRSAARLIAKKVMMVSPLDEWPRPPTFVGGGIRWTRSNKPKGIGWNSLCHYYEVTWSIAYRKLQDEFELLQRTHDPNLIAHFLQRHPYHIDALLTMSEFFQHHGQMDQATDCIKRCIYVFELAWTDQFDVCKGNCRMDIQTKNNDGFFRALFMHMKQIGRRGCMRSAFETAKLLLSLDPHGDPMNVLLAIDYYALTSRQYQFVIDLSDSKLPVVDRIACETTMLRKKSNKAAPLDTSDSVLALPNLEFSLALAQFFLGNESEAKTKLATALLKYPAVLKPLLEKIAVDVSSSQWQPILSSCAFANVCNVGEEQSVLQHLLDIYVTRNHSIWKANNVQSFLLQSAQYALASPAFVSAIAQVLKLPACLHKYARAVKADYSDEVTTLPADHPMLQPPQVENEQLLEALAQEEFAADDLPADANPFLLFLQTLLPWNQVQGVNPRPPH